MLTGVSASNPTATLGLVTAATNSWQTPEADFFASKPGTYESVIERAPSNNVANAFATSAQGFVGKASDFLASHKVQFTTAAGALVTACDWNKPLFDLKTPNDGIAVGMAIAALSATVVFFVTRIPQSIYGSSEPKPQLFSNPDWKAESNTQGVLLTGVMDNKAIKLAKALPLVVNENGYLRRFENNSFFVERFLAGGQTSATAVIDGQHISVTPQQVRVVGYADNAIVEGRSDSKKHIRYEVIYTFDGADNFRGVEIREQTYKFKPIITRPGDNYEGSGYSIQVIKETSLFSREKIHPGEGLVA